MLTPDQFTAFLFAAVLVTATPGPDNLMVLGLGMSKGRRQGMVFGLGCAVGCLSHTALAVLGVSALIAASPVAFTALKTSGGLYLMWLGWQALRSRGPTPVPGASAMDDTPLGRLFLKGMLANAINPKVGLFFLSFLPQFVAKDHGSAAGQIGALGLVFTVQAAVLFGALGYFAGRVGQWLARRPQVGPWLDRVAGGVFMALGLRLVVAR